MQTLANLGGCYFDDTKSFIYFSLDAETLYFLPIVRGLWNYMDSALINHIKVVGKSLGI